MLTGVPVLFCALCMVIVLPGSALEKALLVIVALLYTLLSALAALALGLKMPNLTWTNETTPIKQSGCAMLSLFANWFYALALGGLYFLCGNALSAAVYLAIFAVVTAGGQRAAAPLGETAGRAHLCRALKEKRKPPRSNLDRGGFLLRNALTA